MRLSRAFGLVALCAFGLHRLFGAVGWRSPPGSGASSSRRLPPPPAANALAPHQHRAIGLVGRRAPSSCASASVSPARARSSGVSMRFRRLAGQARANPVLDFRLDRRPVEGGREAQRLRAPSAARIGARPGNSATACSQSRKIRRRRTTSRRNGSRTARSAGPGRHREGGEPEIKFAVEIGGGERRRFFPAGTSVTPSKRAVSIRSPSARKDAAAP